MRSYSSRRIQWEPTIFRSFMRWFSVGILNAYKASPWLFGGSIVGFLLTLVWIVYVCTQEDDEVPNDNKRVPNEKKDQ